MVHVDNFASITNDIFTSDFKRDEQTINKVGLTRFGSKNTSTGTNVLFVFLKTLSILTVVFAIPTFLLINGYYKRVSRKIVHDHNVETVSNIAKRVMGDYLASTMKVQDVTSAGAKKKGVFSDNNLLTTIQAKQIANEFMRVINQKVEKFMKLRDGIENKSDFQETVDGLIQEEVKKEIYENFMRYLIINGGLGSRIANSDKAFGSEVVENYIAVVDHIYSKNSANVKFHEALRAKAFEAMIAEEAAKEDVDGVAGAIEKMANACKDESSEEFIAFNEKFKELCKPARDNVAS